jgi:NAD(P)-dependent dehydrogenase (short-subunit alcohol dehydrogenase family)
VIIDPTSANGTDAAARAIIEHASNIRTSRYGARMHGQRVLVVGASSGIGRAFAQAAIVAGADVVVAARRVDALAEVDGAVPVGADVCEPEGRDAILDACREQWGVVDLVLWAVGRADVQYLVGTDAEAWRRTFATNVEAFNLFMRDAVQLLSSSGIVAVLASETMTLPRVGMIAYGASKAALATSARGWQLEHPHLRFSVVELGPTQPTEFGASFDMDVLVPILDEWAKRGIQIAHAMDTSEMGGFLASVFGAALAHPTIGVEHLVLRPPRPT